jgi:hypothetical protein
MLRAVLVGHGAVRIAQPPLVRDRHRIVLTFGLYAALRIFAANGGLKRMIIVAAIAAIPASFLFSVFNVYAFIYEPLVSRTVSERGRDGSIISERRPGNCAWSAAASGKRLRFRCPRCASC